MFFIYIWRELRRRHRQALLTALGLAVGVGLVVAVTAYASGVSKAQDQVLHSLYGVGTDISVTQTARLQSGFGGPVRFGMNPGTQKRRVRRSRATCRAELAGPADHRRDQGRGHRQAPRRVTQATGGWCSRTPTFPASSRRPSRTAAPPRALAAAAAPAQRLAAAAVGLAGAHPDLIVQPGRRGRGATRASARSAPPRSCPGVSFASHRRPGQGRLGGQGLRQAERLAVGDTIKVSGKKFTIVGIVTGSNGTSSTQRVHPARLGAEAQRQHRPGQPGVRAAPPGPARSSRSRARSRAPCPRRR